MESLPITGEIPGKVAEDGNGGRLVIRLYWPILALLAVIWSRLCRAGRYRIFPLAGARTDLERRRRRQCDSARRRADHHHSRHQGKEIPSPEVEAEAGTYRLEDGSCGIPGIAFRNGIVQAGSAWRQPRGRASMAPLPEHIDV